MKKNIIRIETYDTKKTYDFITGEANDHPNLWEVELFVKPVNNVGKVDSYYNKYPKKTIYVERETLEKSGLAVEKRPRNEPIVEPTETIEDLILRLLEYVGVYPEQ